MIGLIALSIGAIDALVPVIVILILIAAAAGLTRGSDIFRIFGVSTLLGIRTGRGTLSGKSPFKAKARVKAGGGAGALARLAVSPIKGGKGGKLAAGKVQNALSKVAQGAAIKKTAAEIGKNADIINKAKTPSSPGTGTGFVRQAVSLPRAPYSPSTITAGTKGPSTLAKSMSAKLESTVSQLNQKGLHGDKYSIAQANQMRAEIGKLHQLEQNHLKDLVDNPEKAQALKKEFISNYNKALGEVNKNLSAIANQNVKPGIIAVEGLSVKQQIAVYKYISIEKKTQENELQLNQLAKEKEAKQNALTRFNLQRKYDAVEKSLSQNVEKLKNLESKNQELLPQFNQIKSAHSESVANKITNQNVGQKIYKNVMDVNHYLKHKK